MLWKLDAVDVGVSGRRLLLVGRLFEDRHRLPVVKRSSKCEVVNFRQQELFDSDAGVFGKNFSQISYRFVGPDGQAEFYLPRRLVDVEDGDVDGQELLLRDGQRDAEERVERLALPATGRTRQRGVELRLEHVHDETEISLLHFKSVLAEILR